MYLGLDLGTSSFKGLVIDETQTQVATASAPLGVTRPKDNWVEQDPADWIAAIKSVLAKLAETVPLSRVSGIGLSGHMHGATLLGADGTVLAPCILWNDTRAHVQATAMDADPAWRRISGNAVFPGFTAPKLQWLREEQPALFAKVATVLLPKDYVRYWMTGELVSDMSDAAGTSWLDTGKRDWNTELLEKTGLTRAQMPRLVEGSDVSGVLRSDIAQEFGFAAGVPVAGGAGDNAASAIGMGIVARGQSFVSLGTSGVLFAASDAYKPDPATAVHTFCHALPEMWHQMGVILSASDSMTWWGKMLGQSPSALTRDLGALQAPGRTLFLPFLGGERTPWNSASLRGAFVGLEHATDQAAATRAIMEGVSFALADSKAALAGCGTRMTTCLAVGGGSASDYWLAALATALDMPLDVPEGGETGAAFGAARLGMMAATGTTDITTPPRIKRTIDPDVALRDAFAAAHARYTEATTYNGPDMTDFFKDIPEIAYEGPESASEFAFRHYDPDEILDGKSMADHLRFGVAYWHSFAWPGGDPFGGQTFDRPWFGDTMALARMKADVAFEMFRILGQPYYCWHDADVRPEGDTLAESRSRMEEITDYLGEKMEAGGPKLLWGTANLFSNRRFMSGAATNPDPDVFAWSAATVKYCMDATLTLGGENYVLWGGREGYETLLNTDLKREREQAGRFLCMVVDYARKIGFDGQILIEPKPQEPTKHQYDYDTATVYGFLKDFGLENEVKMNLEQGHAILAGHSFEHEIAMAASLGIFGSIDMNRNDYQSGWDTDQFPNNVPEVAMAYYEILKAGGFTTGGTNFDAKLRRQSLDPGDLILAHVGAFDVCARGYKAASKMLADGALTAQLNARYAGWDAPDAKAMLTSSLEEIAARAEADSIQPEPRSGRQERLENIVNRYV